jgi:hypothetical protein
MEKLMKRTDDAFVFYCPGCKGGHMYDSRWTFNGDMDKPTFTPSLLYRGGENNTRCHMYLTQGMILFLSDCSHELAGKTVELTEWPNP